MEYLLLAFIILMIIFFIFFIKAYNISIQRKKLKIKIPEQLELKYLIIALFVILGATVIIKQEIFNNTLEDINDSTQTIMIQQQNTTMLNVTITMNHVEQTSKDTKWWNQLIHYITDAVIIPLSIFISLIIGLAMKTKKHNS